MKQRITATLIRALAKAGKRALVAAERLPDGEGRKVALEEAWAGALVWDAGRGACPGYFVRVWPSGDASFMLKYRDARRGQRWYRLGKLSKGWTSESARREARRLFKHDPATEREALRRRPTLRDAAEEFLREKEKELAARSAREYRQLFETYVYPRIGSMQLASVTRTDVGKIHAAMEEIPAQANRLLAVLTHFFSWADVDPNPVRKIGRYRERKRSRYLKDTELEALGRAMREAEEAGELSPIVTGFFRALIVTGARPGELVGLKWTAVDLERGRIVLGETKTGEADPRARTGIEITPPLRAVLDSLPRVEGSPYVFPSPRVGRKPFVAYQAAWWWLVERAGLDAENWELSPYVIRHTFASFGATMLPMRTLSSVLGHARIATTMRYAHESGDATTRAATTMAATMAAKLEPTVAPRRAGKRH